MTWSESIFLIKTLVKMCLNQELEKKMSTAGAEKEELAEHAMELQIMLANQESVTQGLLQSKQIIIDYLMEDGREALVRFFKMRKGFK